MTNPKTPEALAAARRAAKAFAERHLSTLAAEIIEWQDTAVLRDGKMRELGSICSALDDDHSLQLAESFVSRAALAALAKPQAEPVAEGFVLVPLESTHKMDLAGEEAWENSGHPAPSVASIYKAMLSARPVAQTADQDLGVPPSGSGSSLQPSASTAIPNAGATDPVKADPDGDRLRADAEAWRSLCAAASMGHMVTVECNCLSAPNVLIPRYSWEVTIGPSTARNRMTPHAALKAAIELNAKD
jgi:hypothetical protein